MNKPTGATGQRRPCAADQCDLSEPTGATGQRRPCAADQCDLSEPTRSHTPSPTHPLTPSPTHSLTPSPTHTPLYHTPLDYHDAATKALYLADKYRPVLTGSVLDVGCGKRLVGDAVPRPDLYTGVDINQPCDVVVNLERDPLPFPDASFDVVTCCDVLEHLEAAHRVFDECCRVARSRVIIALPNPARDFIYNLYQNGAGKLKYYGFPGANPGNRHRWFFGFEEAERFVRESAARNHWQVEQLDSAHDGGLYWLNGKGEDVLNHPNLTRGQLWAILRMKDEGGRMKESGDQPESLQTRTKRFALRVIRLYGALPRRTEAQVIGRQLLRSGTSVGAHYRESSRARSDAEFISKMEAGLQELEESVYWLELLVEGGIVDPSRLTDLLDESKQLTAIMVTCIKNAKATRNSR